jgi:predicted DNA binding CopG/RHH family protein
MKGKEKTVLGRRSNNGLGTETFNSTELTGVEKGQKHQVTVRLESSTIEKVENIQEQTGCSFAEAIRRIVRKGLTNSKSRISSQGGRR